jgi:hypothetical protein
MKQNEATRSNDKIIDTIGCLKERGIMLLADAGRGCRPRRPKIRKRQTGFELTAGIPAMFRRITDDA